MFVYVCNLSWPNYSLRATLKPVKQSNIQEYYAQPKAFQSVHFPCLIFMKIIRLRKTYIWIQRAIFYSF
jgi:ribosomal protein S26